jgi:hypothetical protein
MQDHAKEQWERLCAEASVEQDPKRLLELIEKINALLKAKEERLKQQRLGPSK